MLFRLRITTVSEVTIEAQSRAIAEGKRQYYSDDINSRHRHGERTHVELFGPVAASKEDEANSQ